VHTAARAQERSLCGWGGVAGSRCRVLRPREETEIVELLAAPRDSGVIARGAGRSYGDAAQNGGGEVLDMTALDRILSVDEQARSVTAQTGATIARLMTRLAAHGLTLPVVPGTRHVTLGGAIASDIHGKNHHRDGSIARHVTALTLCTPAGVVEVSPSSDPDLFGATLGGMGLTGVIARATLRVEPLSSPWVAADVDRTEGFEQTLALLAGEELHRYSVAWLDLLAPGARMGRAVVSRADPLLAEETAGPRWRARRAARAGRAADPAALLRPARFEVPRGFPTGLLNRASVRIFNELRWRAAPRRERGKAEALGPYFFPLDGLGAWHRLYGRGGLIQYQFVVGLDQEATIVRCVELLRARRLPVYLAVFKRMGPAADGPLSFPFEGWTLALDLPAAAPGLRSALDELDELVAACGGRVYLSKDVRLRREHLRAMYPRLDHFEAVRARVDPDGLLRSDLARRLGLCEAGR
jgi:decaprenylphospho-beta-D-ribofuranose 2-oxidase